MRQAYRVYHGRRTQGAPPWRVEFAGRFVDVQAVTVEGRTRTDVLTAEARARVPAECQQFTFALVGTGVVDVQGDRVVITESEA